MAASSPAPSPPRVEILTKCRGRRVPPRRPRTRVRRESQKGRPAEAARDRHRPPHQPSRLQRHARSGRHLQPHRGLPSRLHQGRPHRQVADRQPHPHPLPGAHERPHQHHRHLHGRRGDHLARPGGPRRIGLHLRRRHSGRGDRPRPDRRPHPDRDLPHRPGGRGHQGLRRGGKSHPQLALAHHDEHGLPPRDGQRRLSGAADHAALRPAQAGA